MSFFLLFSSKNFHRNTVSIVFYQYQRRKKNYWTFYYCKQPHASDSWTIWATEMGFNWIAIELCLVLELDILAPGARRRRNAKKIDPFAIFFIQQGLGFIFSPIWIPALEAGA